MTRTLWDALCEIQYRRGRKGWQYKLPSVLGIAIAAMLAGANDLIATSAGPAVQARGVASARHR